MEILNTILESLVRFYQLIIQNITLDWIIKFGVLYFFIIWWAFIIWIVKDITNRTTNLFLQVLSILIMIIFTPILGLPIYLLIRPSSTIFEKYHEGFEDEDITEWEEENVENIIKKDVFLCPFCSKHIDEDFLYCPFCKEKLTQKCEKCHKDLKVFWVACPYCWVNEEKPKKSNKETVALNEIETKAEITEDQSSMIEAKEITNE